MTAQPALSCDQARQALSARLDGEPLGVPADQLGAHVDACAGCADWLSRAELVTRLVRVQPARVPDLTAPILAAVAADRTNAVAADRTNAVAAGRTKAVAADRTKAVAADRTNAAAEPARARVWATAPSSRQALQRTLQAAVAAIAAMELLVVMPEMLGLGAAAHASHEVGAFAMAVAVAFLMAAFQPRLARAYAPIAIVLAVCLTATSGLDIEEHRVTALHEIGGHWGTIIQAVLILGLGRLYPASVTGSPRRPSAGDPSGVPA